MTERRVALPAVDRVLRSVEGEALIARFGRPLVLDAVRAVLDESRRCGASASAVAIAEASAAWLARTMQPSQRRVFNLTGTVLHTNLGRAPLPEEAIAAATAAMRDPTTLEYDLESGRRGERDDHIAGWLTRLTGAEAALVVNNNAGALVLALNTLAEGRETIVSRGELIEIGGSFRLPDIMARAGLEIVFERCRVAHRCGGGGDRLLRQRRAAEIGMQYGARQIEDAALRGLHGASERRGARFGDRRSRSRRVATASFVQRRPNRIEDQRAAISGDQRLAFGRSQNAIDRRQPRPALRHDAAAVVLGAAATPGSSSMLGSLPSAWMTNPISAAR